MCQYNKMFSHVYVEKGVAEHPRTKQILEKLNNTTVIEIDHYKDVFCRKKQSISAQSNAKALILAENTSGCIYEGAPVCQSFGNENFYYCSCMMNCIFDCEYCYLKGMYPSGNLVVFVNLEDIFAELEALLAQKSIYLCVSYDADLVAIDFYAVQPGVTGQTGRKALHHAGKRHIGSDVLAQFVRQARLAPQLIHLLPQGSCLGHQHIDVLDSPHDSLALEHQGHHGRQGQRR